MPDLEQRLVRARLEQREEQIESAETRIRSELEDLDPVARARVIGDLANPAPTD